jgi:hypothetical protein
MKYPLAGIAKFLWSLLDIHTSKDFIDGIDIGRDITKCGDKRPGSGKWYANTCQVP